MALFAIGDLHMSTAVPKPMDKFGWYDHVQRITEDWKENVKQDDIVLIVGDISWAMKLEDAKFDLEKLEQLPGTKVMIRGNHDYWWSSVTKMKGLFPKFHFIQNNHIVLGNYLIFGTRGWLCPNKRQFDENDKKIYEREVKRLEFSISSYTGRDETLKKVVMLHYPPMNELAEESGFTEILDREGIDILCYGHLHGRESHMTGFQGKRKDTTYHLVSCDYLDFRLKKVSDE